MANRKKATKKKPDLKLIQLATVHDMAELDAEHIINDPEVRGYMMIWQSAPRSIFYTGRNYMDDCHKWFNYIIADLTSPPYD